MFTVYILKTVKFTFVTSSIQIKCLHLYRYDKQCRFFKKTSKSHGLLR
jgi:hypothetical protein